MLQNIYPSLRIPLHNHGVFLVTREMVFMCVLAISPFVFTNLCPSRLQLAHILLPLNIIVIMPSLPLQCQLHVYFLVVSRSTSVVLIPTPLNPQNFKNTPRSVSYLIMNLLLSKFPKGGTTKCVSLQCLYDHG